VGQVTVINPVVGYHYFLQLAQVVTQQWNSLESNRKYRNISSANVSFCTVLEPSTRESCTCYDSHIVQESIR